jgi:transcriptional repressor NrdR
LNCPKCRSGDIIVVDSRDVDTRTIRRRRKCESCDFRFTTYEKVELIKLSVIKRNGKGELFDRDKVIKGMEIAASGRIEIDRIEEAVEEIETKILELGEPTVSTKKIGAMVASRLKKLDEISYLRFASVYKNFSDISSFEQELTKLKK